jgi:CBS domain-containing protein
MNNTIVKDIMTRGPDIIAPDATVIEAAVRMKNLGFGILPVGSVKAIVGMITDRDITLRVVAEGLDPAATLVRAVMTSGVRTVDENEDIETAAAEMHEHDVARLVVTHHKAVTGIVTMAAILRNMGDADQSRRVVRELTGIDGAGWAIANPK